MRHLPDQLPTHLAIAHTGLPAALPTPWRTFSAPLLHLQISIRHSNAPTPRVHQNMDIWCFWWTTRNRRLNLRSFLGWLVEGWHGEVPQHFRCGFYWKTRKMAPQRWWRTPGAGYAETVPAGGETALGAAPMPSAHPNGPWGCGGGHRQSFILSGRHKNGIYGLMACSWGMLVTSVSLTYAPRSQSRPACIACYTYI